MATFKMKRKEVGSLQEELSRLQSQTNASNASLKRAQQRVQSSQAELEALRRDLEEQEVTLLVITLHSTPPRRDVVVLCDKHPS
jgi:peptidoglycan hydrolase CwlO-like protein